jgi:hypothetical protein
MSEQRLKRVGTTAQRLEELPYERRICRVEAHFPRQYLQGEPNPNLPVEEYVDRISEAGFEVCIVSAEFGRGTPRFHSKILTPDPNVDNDMLPLFLERAHEKGILCLTYYPIIYTKPLLPLHPEWQMKFLDDGRPEPENLGWFCFNSPYRDWLPEYLIEYMDNLDLDGFYFDDTNYGTHEDRPWTPSCHCSYCEELFRSELGEEIPRKVDFDSMTFRRFINWRYEKMIDFMHHLFGAIHVKHPDAVLDLNSYIRPQTDWSDGHPIGSLRLEEVGGHFFVETFRSLREPGFVAKVLRSTGTPFSIFRNVTQSLKGFGIAPQAEHYSASVCCFAALANGGTQCGAPLGDVTYLRKDPYKFLFSELKKRVDYLEGDTVKYLALHYSQMNRDFKPSEIPKNKNEVNYHQIGQPDMYGVYEMLNRSHAVMDMVLDEHLTEKRLSQYQVLFLANSVCLADEHCDAIRAFVDAGGTLIATHQTSLLDEWGQERGKFGLDDVLGVEYQGTAGASEDHPVIYIPQDDRLKGKLDQIVCFYGQESEVTARSGTEAICTRSTIDDPGALTTFSAETKHDSGQPVITSNTFGKGQAIYIAGDVGGAYMNSPYPPLRRMIAELAGRCQAPVVVQAPEQIEMTAAVRASGELMIQLVNNPTPLLPWRMDGDRRAYDELHTTFHALYEINPIRDVRITLNGYRARSARLPLQDQKLEVAGDPGVITVPQVDLHEVVLIELE